MMKNLLTGLISVILLITGCKNDGNTPPVSTSKIYLLQKANYVINGTTFTDYYNYDDSNRVVRYYAGRTYAVYTYNYSSNNQLATAQKYMQNGTTLVYTMTFAYNGNVVTATYSTGGSCTILLGSNLEATSICSGDKYIFDSRGNLTQDNMTSSQTDNMYDNKNNPLSMIGAANLHLMYFALGYAQTFKNNILSHNDTYDSSSNSVYTYTYNSAGFPVMAVVVANSGTYTISYTYITK